MSTTPRPWSAAHLWHRDTGAPIQYANIKADKQVIALAVNRDDADLIVTAVNEHDALVAFVVAVRGLDVEAPMIPTAQVRRVLATLDATAPVEGDEA